MKSVTVRAYGKINLFLSVGNITDSGKHEVETVLHRVGIFDTVTVSQSESDGIKLECSDVLLPTDENNIAYLAAKRYFELARKSSGIEIYIEKRIPVKAGMGGGSSDAAAVLSALDKMFGYLEFERLTELASELGADVPFFLYDRDAMLGKGVGTVLSPCAAIKDELYGVFVTAGQKQSTGKMFAELDKIRNSKSLKGANEILLALENGDVFEVLGAIENDFELVNEHFQKTKTELEKLGAQKVFLCGSGPTVCAVFSDRQEAKRVADKLVYPAFVTRLNTK